MNEQFYWDYTVLHEKKKPKTIGCQPYLLTDISEADSGKLMFYAAI